MVIFFAFLGHLAANLWWFLTSGPLVVEPMLSYFIDGYEEWAERYVSRQRRRRISYALSVAGFFVASFLAFSDVYKQLQKTQAELTDAESGQSLAAAKELQWGPLSNPDKLSIVADFRPICPIPVTLGCGSPDGCRLAGELASLIKEAGCSVPTSPPGFSTDTDNPTMTGITVMGSRALLLETTKIKYSLSRVLNYEVSTEEAQGPVTIVIGFKVPAK